MLKGVDMSENSKLVDILFKVLSAGLLPAAMWINTLSVDIAVMKAQIEANNKRIDAQFVAYDKRLEALEGGIKESNGEIQENEVGLGELTKMIEFVKELLTEISDAR